MELNFRKLEELNDDIKNQWVADIDHNYRVLLPLNGFSVALTAPDEFGRFSFKLLYCRKIK